MFGKETDQNDACWFPGFLRRQIVSNHDINSSPPSVAYKRQWIGSALVQIMAFRLFGTKPLSQLVLCYRQFDPSKQTSVKS